MKVILSRGLLSSGVHQDVPCRRALPALWLGKFETAGNRPLENPRYRVPGRGATAPEEHPEASVRCGLSPGSGRSRRLPGAGGASLDLAAGKTRGSDVFPRELAAYRFHSSQRRESPFTNGVSRVRFQAVAVRLMASASVGYGWTTAPIFPRPIPAVIASEISLIISPA